MGEGMPPVITPARTVPRAEGQSGRRMAAAFDAVGELPASAESLSRISKAAAADVVDPAAIAAIAESEPGLAIAIIRAGAALPGMRGRISALAPAIEKLGPDATGDLIRAVPSYETLEPCPGWDFAPERYRRHAVATRHAVELILAAGAGVDRDQAVIASLLHDIGRLVMQRIAPGYSGLFDGRRETPERRLLEERRALGIDHALVGGVLARRWGVSKTVADAISHHHGEEAEGVAAPVRLADLIVHQAAGDPVSATHMHRAAARCGLSAKSLRRLTYDFPHSGTSRPRSTEPSPLSRRESDALRGLGDGKVYREIAEEMGLAASTVRSHLHNVYRKIGAPDRAQAVLLARDKGWI